MDGAQRLGKGKGSWEPIVILGHGRFKTHKLGRTHNTTRYKEGKYLYVMWYVGIIGTILRFPIRTK